MSQENIFSLWKETVTSRPVSRDTFKGMHLAVLQQATRLKLSEQLSVIGFDVQDFVLCEVKGHLQDIEAFELPVKERHILWLCLHFLGRFTLNSGKVSEPDSMFTLTQSDEDRLLTLAPGKQWALFVGISGAGREQLLAELPSLREYYEVHQNNGMLPASPISYVERQALETLTKVTFGPFSAVHHIGLFILKLYTNYLQQLTRLALQAKDESSIQLYHRAVAYIRDNYMDKVLNRETIASALHCSTRSLSRAFEGRELSLNATVLTIRMYKGRELLLTQRELSVEQIALMLHFFDVSHFITQYKKYFHLTPRQERKKLELPDEPI